MIAFGEIFSVAVDRRMDSWIRRPPQTAGAYLMQEQIGNGRFGPVRRATREGFDYDFAIKGFAKCHLSTEATFRQFEKEVKAMIKCDNPYVLRLLDFFEDSDCFYLVTECCCRGDLGRYIQSHGYINDTEARRIFREVLEGVAAIHAAGFAHRDIKPDNIMLDARRHVRIADFGFAVELNDPDPPLTGCGTPGYTAPEVLQNIQCDASKSDVWSCGVVLYVMICGRMPWGRGDRNMLKGSIDIPWTASYACARVLQAFIKTNPADRPMLDEVIKGDWLQLGETTDVPRPLCDVPQLDEDKVASILRQFHERQFRGSRPHGRGLRQPVSGRIKVSPPWPPKQRQITVPRLNRSTLNPPFATRIA